MAMYAGKIHLENLPTEMLEQARFFECYISADGKKIPKITGWNKPENQKKYNELNGLLGFDISGHGVADDYCLIDGDHCIKDGKFVNETVEEIFNFIFKTCETVNCELSISGEGFHILLKPTAGKFSKITNSRQGVFYFDDLHDVKTSPKLEIFYLNESRYCLTTGNVFNCLPNAPIPTGEVADSVLEILLELIENQIKAEIADNQASTEKETPAQENTNTEETKNKNFGSNNYSYKFDCPSEQERAIAMTNCIPCSSLTYTDWLAVGMILKTNGNSLTDWENWSATDSARFKDGECAEKWAGFKDKGGLTIATLHKLAKLYGYSEKDFRRQWYKEHPEFSRKNYSANDFEFEEENYTDQKTKKLSDEDKFALFSLPHTDRFNATRLLMWYNKYIRYLTDSGKWYTYSKKENIWIDGSKENAAVLPFALDMADIICSNFDKKHVTQTEEKLANRWQRRTTYSNAIEVLKGEEKIRITEKDLNTHKNLLNCKNGVIDLQTGKLYKHDSKLLLTQCVNAEYRADCHNETVDKFFNDIQPNKDYRDALLRYLGYCLTGEISEEKALFIHDPGGNGKGTLTSMLMKLFAGYACSFPIESILVQP